MNALLAYEPQLSHPVKNLKTMPTHLHRQSILAPFPCVHVFFVAQAGKKTKTKPAKPKSGVRKAANPKGQEEGRAVCECFQCRHGQIVEHPGTDDADQAAGGPSSPRQPEEPPPGTTLSVYQDEEGLLDLFTAHFEWAAQTGSVEDPPFKVQKIGSVILLMKVQKIGGHILKGT